MILSIMVGENAKTGKCNESEEPSSLLKDYHHLYDIAAQCHSHFENRLMVGGANNVIAHFDPDSVRVSAVCTSKSKVHRR